MTYNLPLYTIIETPAFQQDADAIWSEEERGEFCSWLAAIPEIQGSGGCRKLRWSIRGQGKRGGVRVIYFCKQGDHEIWLLVIYRKAVSDNIPAHVLKAVRELIDNG